VSNDSQFTKNRIISVPVDSESPKDTFDPRPLAGALDPPRGRSKGSQSQGDRLKNKLGAELQAHVETSLKKANAQPEGDEANTSFDAQEKFQAFLKDKMTSPPSKE